AFCKDQMLLLSFTPTTNKPGTCPHGLLHIDSSLCKTWWKCNNDYDCPGEEKCCNTGCGQKCANLGKDI
uniref:WAP domain-containing protein n=1 Tax=Gouania willdenowi TaxID=441366 RepID=A0A8C5DBA2_GOUWI